MDCDDRDYTAKLHLRVLFSRFFSVTQELSAFTLVHECAWELMLNYGMIETMEINTMRESVVVGQWHSGTS